MTPPLVIYSRLNTSFEVVDEIVAESVIRLKKRIPDADIQVTLPSEILMIPMDAMLIEQVLINLLENALLHSHSEQPVELIVENHTHNIYFRIIDHGVGLNEEFLEHIFDGTYTNAASPDVCKGNVSFSCVRAESTIIGQLDQVRSWWMTSIPSISGSPRSSSKTSGQSEEARESASFPVEAQRTR